MGAKESLIDDLLKVMDILKENQIDYALMGGLAFSLLIEPRATMDIDLVIMAKEIEMKNLIRKFEFKFKSIIPHEKPMIFNKIKIWRIVCKTNNHESIIDFILADSEYLKNVLKRSIVINFKGYNLKIISLEDLIILKSISGGDQDKADLQKISLISSEQIDLKYIKSWESKLKLSISIFK
jgi:predicted nucleotidyltransferase